MRVFQKLELPFPTIMIVATNHILRMDMAITGTTTPLYVLPRTPNQGI